MSTLKSGLAAVAAVICMLHPMQRAMAQQTTLLQPSVGQPGYNNNQSGGVNYQPYAPQQQSSQNLYNNSYNAMQNATLSQPGGQQNGNQNQQQQTQIKYFYRGGVNDAHPLRPEELPQRLFRNCPCKDYSSDYPTVLMIKAP